LTTEEQHYDEEAVNRAASFIARALQEVYRANNSSAAAIRRELAQNRTAMEKLAQRLDQQLAQEQEQRVLLASQLTSLATALDRLVDHLQGLSRLMAEMLQRLAERPPLAGPAPVSEPSFPAGGEGISLTLSDVPGFQALMEIQKALQGLEEVANASVERFQEGDSRLLLLLRSPLSGTELAAALHRATGQTIVIQESRPELLRLHLKLLTGG
jgi:hypothetical protein